MRVDEIELDSYENLLDLLKPGGALNLHYNEFIYRGQAEDWALISSAMREEQKKEFNDIFLIEATPSYEIYKKDAEEEISDSDDVMSIEFIHRYLEYCYLKLFYKHANENGLKLPKIKFHSGDYNGFTTVTSMREKIENEWITDDLEELTALARHYGLPTRMLDWSFDIYTALYFAASEVVKNISDSFGHEEAIMNDRKYIVVWALAHNLLEHEADMCSNGAPPIKFVIPNYYTNPNICAQKGILTYWKSPKLSHRNLLDQKICRESLDTLLKNFEYRIPNNETVLYKFKIPKLESLNILKHVSSLGYNAARLFPGYYGVKQKIEEDIIIRKAELIFKKYFDKTESIPTAAHDTTNNSGPSTEKMSKFDIDKIKGAKNQKY